MSLTVLYILCRVGGRRRVRGSVPGRCLGSEVHHTVAVPLGSTLTLPLSSDGPIDLGVKMGCHCGFPMRHFWLRTMPA